MKRSVLALTALLLLTVLLVSCGGKALRNDLPVAVISAEIEPLIPNRDHLDTADDDYLRFNLAGTEIAAERIVRLSVSGTSLDEYGIFLAAEPEDTAALAEACTAYLKQRNDAWMHTYMVEEYPKLRDAEVKVIGQYVVYLILSETEKETVTAAIEGALK